MGGRTPHGGAVGGRPVARGAVVGGPPGPGLVRVLLRPVVRTVPWRMIAAGGGLGLLFAAWPRLMGEEANGQAALTALRASALAFALGAGFLLDDPARHTTAAVPTRRALRHALRLALLLPVAALWWTAALLLAPERIRPPVADITVEAATILAIALTGAALAVRRGDSARPGQAVAGFLLGSAILAPLLGPESWALFAGAGDPRWPAAHDRWTVLLCAVLLTGAASATEPVRRRTLGRLMSPSGTSDPSRG
ncbi:ABC transporter [Streptomyces sp. NPDC086080]|uniref:ABC transporter n=1 Tax=Streptomyces sp. NPDC086080 TaxID=3365748 RepID=UPI0037D95CB5